MSSLFCFLSFFFSLSGGEGEEEAWFRTLAPTKIRHSQLLDGRSQRLTPDCVFSMIEGDLRLRGPTSAPCYRQERKGWWAGWERQEGAKDKMTSVFQQKIKKKKIPYFMGPD